MNALIFQLAPVARIDNAPARVAKSPRVVNSGAAQAVPANAPKTTNAKQAKSATTAPASEAARAVKRSSTAPLDKCATTDAALKTLGAFRISNAAWAKCAET